MAFQNPNPVMDFSGAEYLDRNRNQTGTEKPKGATEAPAAQGRAGSGFVWQRRVYHPATPGRLDTRCCWSLILTSVRGYILGFLFIWQGKVSLVACSAQVSPDLWLVWMYLYFQPLSHQWFWCKTICPLPRKSRYTEDCEDSVQSAVLLGWAVSGL